MIQAMTVQEINDTLKKNEKALMEFYASMSEDFWIKQPEGKWQAGQHLIHLIQSTNPLLKALRRYPRFVLRWKFGTNNRSNRSFEEVVRRYLEKLEKARGAVSPFSRNMPTTLVGERPHYQSVFEKLNDQLIKQSLLIKEQDLDSILLPHPLMGKMTLREILMWNAYHTEHHLNVLKEKY